MPRYKRSDIPGASHFFTVTILEGNRRLLTDHIHALRDSFRAVRAGRPFNIDAMVVLSN